MNYIINPINNQKVSIFSKKGKQILKQYVSNYCSKGGMRSSWSRGRAPQGSWRSSGTPQLMRSSARPRQTTGLNSPATSSSATSSTSGRQRLKLKRRTKPFSPDNQGRRIKSEDEVARMMARSKTASKNKNAQPKSLFTAKPKSFSAATVGRTEEGSWRGKASQIKPYDNSIDRINDNKHCNTITCNSKKDCTNVGCGNCSGRMCRKTIINNLRQKTDEFKEEYYQESEKFLNLVEENPSSFEIRDPKGAMTLIKPKQDADNFGHITIINYYIDSNGQRVTVYRSNQSKFHYTDKSGTFQVNYVGPERDRIESLIGEVLHNQERGSRLAPLPKIETISSLVNES